MKDLRVVAALAACALLYAAAGALTVVFLLRSRDPRWVDVVLWGSAAAVFFTAFKLDGGAHFPARLSRALRRTVLACLAALVVLAGLVSLASPHVDFSDLLAHVAGDVKEGAADSAADLKRWWRRPKPLPEAGTGAGGALVWSETLEGDYAGFGDVDLRAAAARCAALAPRGTWRLPTVSEYVAARDVGLTPDMRADWLAVALQEKDLVLGGAALLSGDSGNAGGGPRRLKARCVTRQD